MLIAIFPITFISLLIPVDFELTQDRDQITKIEIFINHESANELGELVKEIPSEQHDSFIDDLFSVTYSYTHPPEDRWGATQIKIHYADGNFEVIFVRGKYISSSNQFDGKKSFNRDGFINFLNKYGVVFSETLY